MYGEKICMVFSSKNGINIRMEDEWVDLLHNVIPDINHDYTKFANVLLRCGYLLY